MNTDLRNQPGTGDTAADTARNSRGRHLVATALAEHPEFVTAQQLHTLLVTQGVSLGLATVYRNLQALADAGSADTLRLESGELAYRHCSPHHHHHLRCRSCGVTTEISAEPVERWAHEVGQRFNYVAIDHLIEVTGICPQCVSKG
jgi:Fur family ferric uptake transcriptional regulator